MEIICKKICGKNLQKIFGKHLQKIFVKNLQKIFGKNLQKIFGKKFRKKTFVKSFGITLQKKSGDKKINSFLCACVRDPPSHTAE